MAAGCPAADHYPARAIYASLEMSKLSNPSKRDRSHVDLSINGVAKHWAKKLGRPKKEIAAAISKVGNNADTVMKELGLKRSD